MKDTARIDEALTRGVAEVIDRPHLQARLERGDRLRIKLGIDPTGAKLHLGHAVPLRLLRRFQDLGHTVVLIIGDTTASIGDPSGKNETRPPLTAKDIARNFASYEKQALKILDRKRIEFRWQSEWYKKFKLDDVIRAASKLSAGWILSHETFRQRMKAGQPLAFHELLYPLVQAYDSIAIKADVEIGGLDQKFNILTGRELMKAHGLEPQDIVLMKYLVGTDGQKMGKTLGNFIALDEKPNDMFGKIMSMPDTVLAEYFELATDVSADDMQKLHWSGTEARTTKMFLARKIVEQYHGLEPSNGALRSWEKFVQGDSGMELGSIVAQVELDLRELLVRTKIASSLTVAQKLFEQGAVSLDGVVERNWKQKQGSLSAGNHQFVVGKKKQAFILTVKT